jgi:serine/threonine protein kinase
MQEMDFIQRDWLVDPSELEFCQLIGSGQFSNVWLGLHHKKNSNEKPTRIAIKNLKHKTKKSVIKNLREELGVWCSLKSPYIVEFLGISVNQLRGETSILMELCDRGSLMSVLQNPDNVIGWDMTIKFMLEIFAGVSVLHQIQPHQILHRDLKTLNCLVTNDWQCKVADFGFSRFNSESNLRTLSKLRGTPHYEAPEIFEGNPYTAKADIYSLGIILWELVYRCVNGKYLEPYHEYEWYRESSSKQFTLLFHVGSNHTRPTLPPNTPHEIESLYRSCVDADPANRPDAVDALKKVSLISRKYRKYRQDWKQLTT